mmetsp:Transcript_39765/g.78339  ORF Transcript_39765/g.78339 Transcript_39765/m.78339 type:complete len:158 (+) Transcript_39765:2663-3136(+)
MAGVGLKNAKDRRGGEWEEKNSLTHSLPYVVKHTSSPQDLPACLGFDCFLLYPSVLSSASFAQNRPSVAFPFGSRTQTGTQIMKKRRQKTTCGRGRERGKRKGMLEELLRVGDGEVQQAHTNKRVVRTNKECEAKTPNGTSHAPTHSFIQRGRSRKE